MTILKFRYIDELLLLFVIHLKIKMIILKKTQTYRHFIISKMQ